MSQSRRDNTAFDTGKPMFIKHFANTAAHASVYTRQIINHIC